MSKTAEKKARRAAAVPVPTMEAAPIVSEDERLDMIASLKAAEARIAAGEYVEHNPATFADRLMEIRAGEIRNREA